MYYAFRDTAIAFNFEYFVESYLILDNATIRILSFRFEYFLNIFQTGIKFTEEFWFFYFGDKLADAGYTTVFIYRCF